MGNIEAVGCAAIDGAASAVTLTISLAGMMCLWNGIMRVLQYSKITDKLSVFLSPVLRIVFPDAWKRGSGSSEISACLAANILGIGNAATPLALKAMSALDANNSCNAYASDDMVVFTVLCCSSIDIFPTSLIALRRVSGSSEPFSILPPVWICSVCCALLSVLIAKGLTFRRKKYYNAKKAVNKT